MWKATNGRRADYIRNRIAAWAASSHINRHEEMILVACLIFALDRVDNSVGIQQAYLKTWAKRTENALELRDLPYGGGPTGNHKVGDCLKLDYEPADVAYIDPPYSSHSYSTYYHIWDSIARWDKPAVGLKTNRRMDRVASAQEFDADMVSPWNRKGAALNAFMALAERLPVRHLLISYNNESLVPLDDLVKAFKTRYGETAVSVKRIPYKRNIMATIGNAELYTDEHRTENVETLLWISKN
jgi:adenine-specific DNA-methyltransferase